jgi:hypothetical protein
VVAIYLVNVAVFAERQSNRSGSGELVQARMASRETNLTQARDAAIVAATDRSNARLLGTVRVCCSFGKSVGSSFKDPR